MALSRSGFYTAMLIALSVAMVSAPSATGGATQGEPAWTIMVYMADDFATSLPWEDNVDAMEAAEQAEGTNILVLVDDYGVGDSRLLKILHDPADPSVSIISPELDDSFEVIPPSGEVNMASADTLSAFVNFSSDRFPADRYVLILWGHGAGWYGLCPDGTDLLDLVELKQAATQAASSIGSKLDMVVVDACAEATVEVMAQLQGSVDFLVAAESNIPSQGLPYTEILDSLAEDPEQTPEEFGALIVSEYVHRSWQVSPFSATLATLNLSALDMFLASLDEFSGMGVKYDFLFHDILNDALAGSETYGTEWYVDVGDLANHMQTEVLPLEMQFAALRMVLAYDKVVSSFEKYDNPDPVDGVSVAAATGAVIYAPSGVFPDTNYELLSIATTNWDEFGQLARATSSSNASSGDLTPFYVDDDHDGLAESLTLDWDASYERVDVWIFVEGVNGFVSHEHYVYTVPGATIEGLMGRASISASGSVAGVATHHSTFVQDFGAAVRLEVSLQEDGKAVHGAYYMRVLTSRTEINVTDEEDGTYLAMLRVPTDAAAGELITVQIVDEDTHEVVGEERLYTPFSDTSLAVEVFLEDDGSPPGFYPTLFLSLLPGILVLGFALTLYWGDRKKTKA
ncbi:MAG: clostripain-related cysteine peptidase [Thermoplasmata archaeon]|jgi:hypothetical protein|nr:clostripain-related cysteine peptidase [Thermoplasmata archaeon]